MGEALAKLCTMSCCDATIKSAGYVRKDTHSDDANSASALTKANKREENYESDKVPLKSARGTIRINPSCKTSTRLNNKESIFS